MNGYGKAFLMAIAPISGWKFYFYFSILWSPSKSYTLNKNFLKQSDTSTDESKKFNHDCNFWPSKNLKLGLMSFKYIQYPLYLC